MSDEQPDEVKAGQKYAGFMSNPESYQLKPTRKLEQDEDLLKPGDPFPKDWMDIERQDNGDYIVKRSLEGLSPKQLRERGYGKPQSMTDEQPDEIKEGQQYASMVNKPPNLVHQIVPRMTPPEVDVNKGVAKYIPVNNPQNQNATAPRWTPERHQQMLDMKDKGASASEIAKELGVTRNAVIGRINRSGLSDPNDPRALGRRDRDVEKSNEEVRKPSLPRLQFLERPELPE